MKSSTQIIELAKKTIALEAKAVSDLSKHIGADFAACVKLIYESDGRVVVTGIGKSANIANKIVATLNSTGTPSAFMHAADALHGDLGMVQKNDVIICISKSGDTAEIKALVPLLKITGNKLIALVGNTKSYLAKQTDYIINAGVIKEACSNDLVPTSSTTAQLVLGDALAVCLMYCRGFSGKDFARYHPGGALGKKLYLTVGDLCCRNEVPRVDINTNIKSVIVEISSKRLGTTAVMKKDKLVGIITDGDLRRMLQGGGDINTLSAGDIMAASPKTVDKDTLAANALNIMEQNKITQVLVTDKKLYIGVVHLHDILKEGIL